MALLTFVLSLSCVSKKRVSESAEVQETNPKLIFLNYNISKDENGKKHVAFINKTITDGKLKEGINTKKTGTIGDLKCSQLNKDSIEIQSVIKDNPLVKMIEYVNDSLIFERKKIELNNASLSLRMSLSSRAKFMVISEIIDSLQNTRPLITTKLD
ncbi:hypothetical protein KO566_03985 [Flavobacteriaceae bacterium XHP0103]|uniref:hypothetical protein n=1 Tax=Marixanthotalea marina TaxID=2844359 RepID=UPI002989B013|nr:hypothetical protein [Marixanthotalea marina]MBU3821210.1 hypothetical protein [Marixanthotalea marina]